MSKQGTSKMITIRGVTYANAVDAAAALGVVRDTIIKAKRLGRLETVGLKRRYKDFEINGKTFASLRAAAKFYGVCEGRIEQAVRAGKTGALGTRKRPSEMQVSVRGRVFKDAQAAADAFGVGRSAIYAAICQGRIDRLGLPVQYGLNNTRPFSAGGYSWPSEAAACRDLGLRREFICRMRKRNSERMRARLVAALMQFTAARDAQARKERLAAIDRQERDAA
ncbi:hypothetical protein [Albirhodobacter sp. R86504]|uniref:hypothetical protein n=1 Tax=Albirhodobacter sp. R86504 TaxID=3093848 RepID=UPI003672A4E1